MIQDNPEKRETVKAEQVRPRGVWIEKFLPCGIQNVHILKRISGNIRGIS